MTGPSTRSVVPACVIGLVAMGGAAAVLHARSSFTVDPMQIQLSRQTTSQLVTVTNESASEIRFEIKAFKWAHDDAGEMQLSDASEIVLFPNLVTVAPRAQQRVRVGTTASYGSVEGDYRLFVEELPPASTGTAGAPRVAMRTRIGIPLFLAPASPAARAEVSDVRYSNGEMTARVRNTGNMHVMVGTVQFLGAPATGSAQTFDHSVTGWYVLPGRSQVFHVPVTRAECQATGKVTVQARVNDQTLTATGGVTPSACTAN
jgi:fimbrial chaperone protein